MKKTLNTKEDSIDDVRSDIAPCSCLKRTKTPEPPKLDIEFDTYLTEELKNIILKHYTSSTFNTCTHQPLPKMHGPPLELHVNPDAKPYIANIPTSSLAHWEKQVKDNLARDIALGVIEEVEPNTPVRLCHRMILQRKHNGDPRQTVNLQHLNETCIPYQTTPRTGTINPPWHT